MVCAKTGRSPNRNTAQGNTLGNSEPSNLRSERAIGMILRCVLATSFCSFRAPNSSTNPTQGDTLGYNPTGASPRSCSTIDCLHKLEQQFVYYVSSCSTVDIEYFLYFLLIEFLTQGIVALFVLLWLQWNIIDFNFVLGYFCAQRRGKAPKGMIVQGVVQQSMLWAKTGRSPSRITAQGNTLGNSEPSNLRSERAIGMILRCVLATSFCSFRAPNSSTNPTQGDTLGYNPIGASPRSCSWSFPLYAFLSPYDSNQWLVNTCPFPSPLLLLAPLHCIILPYHHCYTPPPIIATIP